LPADIRNAHSEIDWRRLISFRDFLAHNYKEVILEFVWEAVKDIPPLRERVEHILQSLGPLADTL
jgi:uncharacterized protein with HEPN domain